jgi:protein gp37
MGDQRSGGIAWTEETWNVIRGCSRVSSGCQRCYAERQAARMAGPGQAYEGLVRLTVKGPRWTGEVAMVPEKLGDPLRWRRPRRVFVNSMSDLFHERLTNEQIAAIFGVMAAAPRHTFQVLTKRPQRMQEWFRWLNEHGHEQMAIEASCWLGDGPHWDLVAGHAPHPLPNVWLGVSVEDQLTADQRIPYLLETPAAVRFVSYEPALGPVNLRHLDAEVAGHPRLIVVDALIGRQTDMGRPCPDAPGRLSWVIAGSESGPGARPADLEWFRSVARQCQDAQVPYFLKQFADDAGHKIPTPELDGRRWTEYPQ